MQTSWVFLFWAWQHCKWSSVFLYPFLNWSFFLWFQNGGTPAWWGNWLVNKMMCPIAGPGVGWNDAKGAPNGNANVPGNLSFPAQWLPALFQKAPECKPLDFFLVSFFHKIWFGFHHLIPAENQSSRHVPEFQASPSSLAATWRPLGFRILWDAHEKSNLTNWTCKDIPNIPQIQTSKSLSEANESNCNRTKIWNQLWRIWRQTQALKRNNLV